MSSHVLVTLCRAVTLLVSLPLRPSPGHSLRSFGGCLAPRRLPQCLTPLQTPGCVTVGSCNAVPTLGTAEPSTWPGVHLCAELTLPSRIVYLTWAVGAIHVLSCALRSHGSCGPEATCCCALRHVSHFRTLSACAGAGHNAPVPALRERDGTRGVAIPAAPAPGARGVRGELLRAPEHPQRDRAPEPRMSHRLGNVPRTASSCVSRFAQSLRDERLLFQLVRPGVGDQTVGGVGSLGGPCPRPVGGRLSVCSRSVCLCPDSFSQGQQSWDWDSPV